MQQLNTNRFQISLKKILENIKFFDMLWEIK